MASTARKEDEKREYFDSPEELDRKVSQLAEWIRESRHIIAFTVSRRTHPSVHMGISITLTHTHTHTHTGCWSEHWCRK